MKILYGVQGTGNGHISRAMAMAAAFQQYKDIDITWLISGRDSGKTYGLINEYEWREGMTLITVDGKVSLSKTFAKNSLLHLLRDIRQLDFKGYDLVFSDFEPVISHAAKRQGVPVTGISHQSAFLYDIPTRGTNFISNMIMRNFAPVSRPVGLHWHHFDQPLLPPILHIDKQPIQQPIENKVLVYLPMENAQRVIEILKTLSNYEFYFYHPDNEDRDEGHLHIRAVSVDGFKRDLYNAAKVICNSGFELISECLYLGKSILAKPLKGQMEQLSNARALEVLGYASVIENITEKDLKNWLNNPNISPKQIAYPDVAATLAKWIVNGCEKPVEDLSKELWSQVPAPSQLVQAA